MSDSLDGSPGASPGEELKERVARGERRLLELARVPRDHDMATAGWMPSELGDDVPQLITMVPIWGDPVTPLLAVVPPRVAFETRLRQPVRRIRIPVPDAHAERVQLVHVRRPREEPEHLGEHRAERETLRGDRGEAVAHAKAHDLAEDGAGARARAIVAIGTGIHGLAQDGEVLAHRYAAARR